MSTFHIVQSNRTQYFQIFRDFLSAAQIAAKSSLAREISLAANQAPLLFCAPFNENPALSTPFHFASFAATVALKNKGAQVREVWC